MNFKDFRSLCALCLLGASLATPAFASLEDAPLPGDYQPAAPARAKKAAPRAAAPAAAPATERPASRNASAQPERTYVKAGKHGKTTTSRASRHGKAHPDKAKVAHGRKAAPSKHLKRPQAKATQAGHGKKAPRKAAAPLRKAAGKSVKPSRGKTPTHAKKSHTVKKTAKRQVSRTSDVRQAKRPSKAGAYKTKHAGKSAKHVAKMPGKHQIKVKPAKRPVEAKAKRRR